MQHACRLRESVDMLPSTYVQVAGDGREKRESSLRYKSPTSLSLHSCHKSNSKLVDEHKGGDKCHQTQQLYLHDVYLEDVLTQCRQRICTSGIEIVREFGRMEYITI